MALIIIFELTPEQQLGSARVVLTNSDDQFHHTPAPRTVQPPRGRGGPMRGQVRGVIRGRGMNRGNNRVITPIAPVSNAPMMNAGPPPNTGAGRVRTGSLFSKLIIHICILSL